MRFESASHIPFPGPCLMGLALCLAWARTAESQGTCAFNDADFRRVVLQDRPPEPTRLAILPDGRVLWTEKRGTVKIWLPQSNSVELVYQTQVFLGGDNGFHGLALDPAFAQNGWVYMAYDPSSDSHAEGAGRWLSRFTLVGNRINAASEKRILHFKIDRNLGGGCCHQGGALLFDRDGNLLYSVGEQLDYNPGIASFNENNRYQNAFSTVGNTNDLRGKVLRIRPKPIPDATPAPAAGLGSTYDVPEGNLFPPGMAKTRPEIYAMGFRNPYTLGYDARTGFLFVGDVGMDHYVPDPEKGPPGHDEIHLVKKAGHYGYPFAVGNNEPLRHYDYVANRTGPAFDLDNLSNNSRFNTGLTDLRPAGRPIPPILYYTNRVAYSKDWPQMGDGRMAAFVGPTYRYDASRPSTVRWPAFLDGRLFVWDQERDALRLARLDAEGKVAGLDRILAHIPWKGVMDLKFGPDGAMYVIEYGHSMGNPNPEAKLSRVEYLGPPCGTVSASPLPAARAARAPLRLYHGGPESGAGLTVPIPAGAAGFAAYDLEGRRLWAWSRTGSHAAATEARIPAGALGTRGLVLVRYRN